MATPDHTVPARPSLPPDGTRTPHPGRPPSSGKAKVTQRRSPDRDGIAVAVFALTCLLIESEASERGLEAPAPDALGSWPLSSRYVVGVSAAIDYLNQYARLLGREPRVTT